MTKMKSTKTYADNRNSLYKLIKGNISDSYFLEVLYYHVRLALIKTNFNLYDVDAFNISGKYLGYDILVDLNRNYDSVIKSISLVLSLRAFMINGKYIKYCYDDELLFCSINSNYLSWDSHRVIMECIDDEDFSFIYDMIISYKKDRYISEELSNNFKDNTIKPEYHHHEEFCKELAAREDYHGTTVIKNNSYLCSGIDSFVVNKVVEYIGNTAFAYCENLKEIEFEGKVMFGHFPIIECHNLQRIIVPAEYLDYYKTALPYYKNIICDPEHKDKVQKIEEPHVDEPNKEVEEIDDLQIEHVYVDSTSSAPYVEIEEEPEPQIDFGKINEIFEKKATSYKFFWFLSIMDIYLNKKQKTIPYKNLVAKMVAKAWKYWFVDKFSFGIIDQLGSYLNIILNSSDSDLSADSSEIEVESYIIDNYVEGYEKLLTPLLKNVPFRFLSPWIPFTTTSDVIEKSNDPATNCLYALKDDSIELNEFWLGFLKQNADKIIDFTISELNMYLEQNNR